MCGFVSRPGMWRVWEERDDCASASKPAMIPFPLTKASMDFTVMSYNILADDLLQANPELYTHCSLEILDWNYRCSLILEEINKWAPDVSHVCLFFPSETGYFFISNLKCRPLCPVCRSYVSKRFRRTTIMNIYILPCLKWVGHLRRHSGKVMLEYVMTMPLQILSSCCQLRLRLCVQTTHREQD